MSIFDPYAKEVIKRVHKISPDVDAEEIAVIAGVALGVIVEDMEKKGSSPKETMNRFEKIRSQGNVKN